MSDKIIPFPVREKEKLFARCPNCEGFSWEIEVDGPNVEKIHSFNCATPDCGYKIPLIMSVSLNLADNEDVFNFEPDTDIDHTTFTLEDDDE